MPGRCNSWLGKKRPLGCSGMQWSMLRPGVRLYWAVCRRAALDGDWDFILTQVPYLRKYFGVPEEAILRELKGKTVDRSTVT
jgi:hypothetical protein